MAIALVAVGAIGINGGVFGQPATAGNLLVAWASNADPVAGTLVQTPSGWTKACHTFTTGAYIFYKENCAGGETSVAMQNGGESIVYAAGAEFSGVETSGALDKTGISASGVSPRVATAASADVAAGQLVVTAGAWRLSKAGSCVTADTYNNGATPTTNLNYDANALAHHPRFAWGITTGNASADSDSQTNDSMNISFGGLALASFKVAGVAAATSLPPLSTTRPTRYQI